MPTAHLSKSQLVQDVDGHYTYTTTTRLESGRVTGTAEDRLFNALNDSFIRGIGASHPTIPNVTVHRKRAYNPDPMAPDIYDVELTYDTPAAVRDALKGSDPIVVTWSPYTVEEQTSFDRDGSQMRTQFLGTRRNHRATIERPVAQVTVTRTVGASPDILNDVFAGTTNAVAIQFGGNRTFNADTIRCDYFTGSYERGDNFYRVTGHFTMSPFAWGDWRLQVVAHNGWTPVDDPTEVNGGFAYYSPYPQLDHRSTGLVF